jgi:hypothetical protein
MELNITAFVLANADNMERFSDSIANSGLQNIGQVTWRNAMAAMQDESSWLCSELSELVDHFAEYGAWEREELEAMSGQELNALLVQFVAGDYQETQEGAEEHRLYCDNDGQWFAYLGC